MPYQTALSRMRSIRDARQFAVSPPEREEVLLGGRRRLLDGVFGRQLWRRRGARSLASAHLVPLVHCHRAGATTPIGSGARTPPCNGYRDDSRRHREQVR